MLAGFLYYLGRGLRNVGRFQGIVYTGSCLSETHEQVVKHYRRGQVRRAFTFQCGLRPIALHSRLDLTALMCRNATDPALGDVSERKHFLRDGQGTLEFARQDSLCCRQHCLILFECLWDPMQAFVKKRKGVIFRMTVRRKGAVRLGVAA